MYILELWKYFYQVIMSKNLLGKKKKEIWYYRGLFLYSIKNIVILQSLLGLFVKFFRRGCFYIQGFGIVLHCEGDRCELLLRYYFFSFFLVCYVFQFIDFCFYIYIVVSILLDRIKNVGLFLIVFCLKRNLIFDDYEKVIFFFEVLQKKRKL